LSADLDHLARLAGLELSPQERLELQRRLALLQDLIRALPDADPDQGPARNEPRTPLRSDRPEDALPVEIALRSTASRSDGWLDCPEVGERGD
jgi:Asp-tRNA(Asn)/Glu-tRNA(Gln) amidotransferase C subunit